MIWIPVCILGCLVIGIWYVIEESCSISEMIVGLLLTPLLSSFLGFLLGCVLAVLFGIFSPLFPADETIISETPISAISDNNGIDGRFFLGCGTIDSDLYIYYSKESDIGKEIEKVKMSDVVIVEDDSDSPNVKIQGERLKWKWLNMIMFDANCFHDKTILTVPPGTMTSEYILDLQ